VERVKQNIVTSVSRSQIALLVAIGLQVGVLVGLSVFLPEILRPLTVIVAFVLIPGTMTALLTYWRQALPFWQIVGLGLSFGLGEVLILGRLLLALGVPVSWLGYVLFALTLLLAVWLWRRLPDGEKPVRIDDWQLLIIPMLVLMAIWIMLVQVNLTYPTYPVDTVRLNDKWSYLTIIEQFLVSPGRVNLRPDTIIIGSNTRLSWNSWLYFTAAVSQFTGIQPIQLIFHYLRPGLFLLPVFSLFLLGYELFQKSWAALAATALQLLLLIGVDFDGFWVWMRLEEDKYFAFVTLMPLAWVFLLRALKDHRRSDVIGLGVVSVSLALLHPLGIPGLLLTGVPITLAEWWFNRRKGFSFRWLLLVLAVMGLPIIITIVDQILILATPYVQNYIETEGSLRAYTPATAPILLPPNATFILLLLIPLAAFALKDRTARFLLLVAGACAAVLCVPIITAFISRITTAVGMNRYHWLIPYGFIVVFLILKISERLSRRHRSHWLYPTVLTTGAIAIVVILSGWHQWTVDHNFWLFRQDTPQPNIVLDDTLWRAFSDTADKVEGKLAITPVEYGLIAPTVWPRADLLIFNSSLHAPVDWSYIEALYQSQDIASAWIFLDKLQPQALFVPHTTNLYAVLSQNSDSFKVLYKGEAASLFAADIVHKRQTNDVIVLVADQYTLKPGECVQLQWATARLENIRLDGQRVDKVGSQQVCQTQNTIHTLEGIRPDGSTVSRNIHLFVSPDYDYMINFYADRYVIQSGECAILRWHVEGIDSIYYQNTPSIGESYARVCPTADAVYSLRIKLRTQEIIIRNITIYIRD
jgi:hypothetical protein